MLNNTNTKKPDEIGVASMSVAKNCTPDDVLAQMAATIAEKLSRSMSARKSTHSDATAFFGHVRMEITIKLSMTPDATSTKGGS